MIGLGLEFSRQGRGQQVAQKPNIVKLIDGEFFRSLCLKFGSELQYDIWGNLNWNEISDKHRTFIYDSLPSQKPNQDEQTFKQEFDAAVMELDRLGQLPNIFVKDGLTRFRSKEKRREQKGVDVLLAIDAVLLAIRGIADELHIYTNDLDFFPVFEALQSTSCRGRLFFKTGSPPISLINYADSAEPIKVTWLLRACGRDWGHTNSIFPRPSETPSGCSPFFQSQTVAGRDFSIRAPQKGIVEVSAFFNEKFHVWQTDKALLAFALAEKFCADPPHSLLMLIRDELAK